MALLRRLIGHPGRDAASSAVAKQRLTFVLQFDRAHLSPGELELIKNDVIEAISRHVAIARDGVEVTLDPSGRLVVEIPLSRRPSRQPQTGT